MNDDARLLNFAEHLLSYPLEQSKRYRANERLTKDIAPDTLPLVPSPDQEKGVSTYQKPTQTPPRSSWLGQFSATFTGALLAGFLLLLVVRWYVRSSVQEGVDTVRDAQVQDWWTKSPSQIKPPTKTQAK